ncbi:DUF5405 family protein [Serratia marcescens]|uniref:DUF5405 family protein n=1 Tax=Serratia TaxID=613 RepID=UPI000C133D65|nr:DUF5405 family protein [Serratia marcescens]MBN3977345.1 DUF5405 family protein [Serratia marcescens]PHY81402.1 hypothetical protein CS371_17790 [Serratia marcescens]BEO75125.1 hypothetical protein SMTE4_10950 [Serratia marcescens]HAT4516332.1 hypothetical protein [Serratia marcescens]
MELKIGLKYVVTSTTHDFVLNEVKTVKEGKNAGNETLSVVGYFTKLSQLVTYLIAHDIKGSDVDSISAMEAKINDLSRQIETAFLNKAA